MSRWTIPSAWRRLQAAGRLDQAVDRLDDRHRPALADDAVEVAARDVVHHQEMHAAVLVGVLSGDEVGVPQAAGGLDLAAEPHHGLLVAREGGREDLQGADPPQPTVSRLEDHAHAALAELVEDEIVADQQAAALLLVDRGRLVGRQLAGLDQGARPAQHPPGGIGGEGRELVGVDQADLDERAREIVEVRDASRCRAGVAIVRRGIEVIALRVDDRLGFLVRRVASEPRPRADRRPPYRRLTSKRSLSSHRGRPDLARRRAIPGRSIRTGL